MSREIPYQPMGQRKAVPESRMQEILAKHAQRLQAGQSPQAKADAEHTAGPDQQPSGLVWSPPRHGLGFVYIDAGPYRITRQNKKYDCHRDYYYLGTCGSAEAAKRIADEDVKCR